MTLLLIIIVGLLASVCVRAASWICRRSGARSPLDIVLWRWSEGDAVTVRHLLSGGLLVFGRSGSGKTSSSGKVVGRSVIGHPRSGGLILAAKPEDKAMWIAIFEKAGRKQDLFVFEPDGKWRFDFIDHVMKSGGHTREITRCIKVIGETLRASDAKGGGEDGDFWEQQQERMIYNAVELVKQGHGRVTAWDIHQFISSAPYSIDQLQAEGFRAGFCYQTLQLANKRSSTAIEKHDLGMAVEYFLNEFPRMADKTRSSILAGVMGILHVFNTGIVRELVCTTTNVSPDVMGEGKWVLVNMAPAEWGDIGNFVNAGWKYLTQRWVLRRHADEGDCINVIWCDEANQFVNSHDAHYLAQCRSHLGCMVFLTQSLHSFYATLKGPSGRSQADALLANFTTKVFHALGDVETATWASELIGKSLQTFIGGSMSPPKDLWAEVMGYGEYQGSFNEHFEAIVQPNAFLNGLRTGGSGNGLLCDAIVIKSGETFSTGSNWMRTAFSQR